MLNRLTHIRQSVKDRLGSLKKMHVLDDFNIGKWTGYNFPYVYVLNEGELQDTIDDYENGEYSGEQSKLSIGVYCGFSNSKDLETEREKFTELLRTHLHHFKVEDVNIPNTEGSENVCFGTVRPAGWEPMLKEENKGLIFYSFSLTMDIT